MIFDEHGRQEKLCKCLISGNLSTSYSAAIAHGGITIRGIAMYDENDFTAISKFLKLGIKITFRNPMGQNPSFQSTFPTPKGATVTLDEKSLYDVERKLRALIGSDVPVKTKLAPFTYLGTNFRGLLYCTKGSNEYIVQETHDLFGTESKRIVRTAEHFIQLLS